MDRFQNKMVEWNITYISCFGNIFHKKRRLMARMEGINGKLSMGQQPYLSKLIRKLRKEYDSVLA